MVSADAIKVLEMRQFWMVSNPMADALIEDTCERDTEKRGEAT